MNSTATFRVVTAASIKMSSGMLQRVIWHKFTDVSEVRVAFIIRMVVPNTKCGRRTVTSCNTHP
jgi:hypothetical protein